MEASGKGAGGVGPSGSGEGDGDAGKVVGHDDRAKEGAEGQADELPDPGEAIKQQWALEQEELKQRLVEADAHPWTVPDTKEQAAECGITHVAGVDISFIKGDAVNACASLVVLSFPDLEVVWEAEEMVKLELPYVPGYLAFREVPHLLPLFEKLKNEKPEFYPQVVFVDGNGVLHPRGFGLASHLGVLCDIPTIGVAKTFFFVDGLVLKNVKAEFLAKCKKGGDWIELVGESKRVWGAAFRSTDNSTSPIFVSVGHRLSLQSAVALSKFCSLFRVPEPTRQADLRSREFLRQLGRRHRSNC